MWVQWNVLFKIPFCICEGLSHLWQMLCGHYAGKCCAHSSVVGHHGGLPESAFVFHCSPCLWLDFINNEYSVPLTIFQLFCNAIVQHTVRWQSFCIPRAFCSERISITNAHSTRGLYKDGLFSLFSLPRRMITLLLSCATYAYLF